MKAPGPVSAAWRGWKRVAHMIGNFQARVLLTLFYFVIVPPFALLIRLFKDPFRTRRTGHMGYWIERTASGTQLMAGRRQF